MNEDVAEFIRLAREGHAPISREERKAIANHIKYLRIRARDPEYYTRRRRMERRNRKGLE
ncbi:hypothetical protein BW14_10620 [Bifidobacterium sp. UTBIF-68]|uniref:hypothetical protein n=1 Tax=Bifidobacterium sp. UTBIF-68 TaxID=1465262 RepID=UPI00112C8273|nr:hypothetical protein [Bifidobacterium sp. UTBIF-68]TPF91961.1 hypothetical protein BW14_10620 [Bifidobacterium sp. UTBIF-68]